jgi:hypothetical protein
MTVIIRGKISEVLLLGVITNINCSQSMLYQIKLKANAERRCRNFFFVNFFTLLVLLLYLNANSRMQNAINIRVQPRPTQSRGQAFDEDNTRRIECRWLHFHSVVQSNFVKELQRL